MHWLYFLAIYVVVFSIKDIIRKYSLNRFDNMAVLSFEFSSTAIIFVIIALIMKIPLVINVYTLTFLGIGVLHGLGTIGKVNAMNLSLSKTALLSKYKVIMPMLLGFFVLKEGQLLTLYSLSGFLKVMALLLFPVSLYLLQKTHNGKDHLSKIWLFSMLQFFIFHALLDYLMKINVQPQLVVQAIVFQRLSAALVVLINAIVTKTKFPLDKRLFITSSFNGALICIASFTNLSALVTAPLIIYKPLEKMLTISVITFAGLFIFGEHKKINSKIKLGYLVTTIGALLLIVSEVLDLI